MTFEWPLALVVLLAVPLVLGVYLLAYIPVMFGLRWLLRIA